MTNAALAWGCAMVAFSPILSLLFFLSYPKAQLVIVVTTAAFFFLCSALVAGLIWYVLDEVIGLPGGSTLWVLIPGVLSQFLFRCAFVRLYHMVEQVIQASLERFELQHERQQQLQQQQQQRHDHAEDTVVGSEQTLRPPPRPDHDSDSDNVVLVSSTAAAAAPRNRGNDPNAAAAAAASQQQQQHHHHQWARLQLELNDFSCALAAATGFGGMHAILFYGTLLASETSLNGGNANGGTLYQPSCLNVPSLAVSAMNTCLFSILDVVWMLLTFFGMRRRLLFHRSGGGGGRNSNESVIGGVDVNVVDVDDDDPHPELVTSSSFTTSNMMIRLSNSRGAGNFCLVFCLLSHMAASLATTANSFTNGCVASLPFLSVVTLLTALMYVMRIHKIYLPVSTTSASGAASLRPLSITTSSIAAGGGGGGTVVGTTPGAAAAAAASLPSDPYHRD